MNQFRIVSDGTALFQTSQFARISPTDFLCLADFTMTSGRPNSLTIFVDDRDLQRFSVLTRGEEELKKAIKSFRKRDKGMDAED